VVLMLRRGHVRGVVVILSSPVGASVGVYRSTPFGASSGTIWASFGIVAFKSGWRTVVWWATAVSASPRGSALAVMFGPTHPSAATLLWSAALTEVHVGEIIVDVPTVHPGVGLSGGQVFTY